MPVYTIKKSLNTILCLLDWGTRLIVKVAGVRSSAHKRWLLFATTFMNDRCCILKSFKALNSREREQHRELIGFPEISASTCIKWRQMTLCLWCSKHWKKKLPCIIHGLVTYYPCENQQYVQWIIQRHKDLFPTGWDPVKSIGITLISLSDAIDLIHWIEPMYFKADMQMKY